MPQVPYQPYSTARPIDRGEQLRPEIVPAAFGVNIGAALQQLGSDETKAGDEIWNRGLAIQALNNETDARVAASNAVEQMGKLQATYDSSTGKDSSDMYDNHVAGLRAALANGRASLGTADAQRMYDQMTFGFLERNVYSSARHMGDENRNYVIQGYQAQYQTSKNAISASPDPATYQKNVAVMKQNAANVAMVKFGIHDPNDPIVQNAADQAEREGLAEMVKGVADDGNMDAEKMLEANKEKLGELYSQTQDYVRSHLGNVISSNLVDGVMAAHRQADGTYDVNTADMQKEVEAKAKAEHPNFPQLAKQTVNELDTKVRLARWAIEQDHRDTVQGIAQLLTKYPNITDAQSLQATPEGKALYNKLTLQEQTEVPQWISRVRSTEFKEEWAVNKVKANGLKNADLNTFLNTDFMSWNMDPKDREQAMQDQIKLSQDPKQDPRPVQAYHLLENAYGPQLQALGVDPKQKNDPNSAYIHLLGTLQEQILEWQAQNKKPPTPQDILGPIWQQLSATHAGRFWGQNPNFMDWQRPLPKDVPQEFTQEAIEQARSSGNIEPTPSMIYRAYLRLEFQKVMGASSSENQTVKPKTSNASQSVPTVPTSQ